MNKKKVKKIYYSNIGVHTYIQNLIDNPPEGYTFVVNAGDSKKKFVNSLKENKLIKNFYTKTLKRKLNVFPFLHKFYTGKAPGEVDLVFSFGTLYEGDKPWVLKVPDNAFSLAGNDPKVFFKNKKELDRRLMSNSCKKIIIHTKWAQKEFEKYFSKPILDKVELVYPSIKFPVGKKKSKTDKKITFLFMGSMNNPKEFIMKGGIEALEIFTKLRKSRDDIEFVIKCNVPEEIRKKYDDDKITYIQRYLSDKEIEELYQKTDLLLMPAYGGYFVSAYLECFANGIPIVALDAYGVSDFVVSGETGLCIKPAANSPILSKDYPINMHSSTFLSELRKSQDETVEKVVKELKKLIDNPELISKMSQNCQKAYSTKFSFENKSKKLKKIFDEATST